jgi:hypothetical protein
LHEEETRDGHSATPSVATLGGFLAAALVAACSPLPPYESTAADLVRAGRGTSLVEFSTEWKPLTKGFSEALSDEENVRGRFWLSSCVNELDARFTPAPNGTVRALQIAECMAARGWHLVVREAPGCIRSGRPGDAGCRPENH